MFRYENRLDAFDMVTKMTGKNRDKGEEAKGKLEGNMTGILIERARSGLDGRDVSDYDMKNW